MLNRFCIILMLFLSIVSTYAQTNFPKKNGIIVQFDAQNKPFIQYQVLKGQNLFQIRSKYGLSERELIEMNPSITSKQLNAGQWLNIPIAHLMTFSTSAKETLDMIPVYYQTKPKESLYNISKTKTSWNTSLLKAQNHLKDDMIRPDQWILVAYLSNLNEGNIYNTETVLKTEDSKEKHEEINALTVETDTPVESKKYEALIPSFKNEVRGVAYGTNNSSSSNYYALYNKAKTGSLIEIYNPVVEKSVLAKVIGKIPANYSSDIQVVVSNAVMQTVGALGPKFFVYIRH